MTIERSRRTRLSGLTLLEMLIATTIFMGLNGAVLALLHYNQKASEKATANADAGTQVLVLFEKLRLELRTGRIVECSEDTLGYWIYQRDTGLPVFGVPHRLAFLPGGGAPPDLAELTAVGMNGNLTRRFQGREEPLARVGQDGEVRFLWTPALQMLRVEGSVGERGRTQASRETLKEFRFTVPLNNIE
jgi:type II secretory pathway pseudopilin PulG